MRKYGFLDIVISLICGLERKHGDGYLACLPLQVELFSQSTAGMKRSTEAAGEHSESRIALFRS